MKLPLVPTLIVLAAVGVMIRLGFWQIDRLHQKESMIARYQAAMAMPVLDWSDGVPLGSHGDYRRVRLRCDKLGEQHQVGGRNASGQSGWAHWVDCVPISGSVTVVAGWSRDLAPVALSPGVVTGYALGGDAKEPLRIVADPPLGALVANARPDPRDLPNNHFSYAVQWFLFAATALVIYGIAVWKRGRDEAGALRPCTRIVSRRDDSGIRPSRPVRPAGKYSCLRRRDVGASLPITRLPSRKTNREREGLRPSHYPFFLA
jgi:surfeit locus 1 family protein